MRVVRFGSVSSTMDVCRELHARGQTDGLTLVVADEQTAGRGRAGHAWFSPPGSNLYLSLLAYPDVAPAALSKLTMLGALAVRDAVISRMPSLAERMRFKWFNDVMLDGKKLAGVLLESAITDGQVDCVVLGIGVNVNAEFDRAPADVRDRAISLRQILDADADRETFLYDLTAQLERRYAQFTHTPARISEDYAALVDTVGRIVHIRQGDEWISGLALRVEPDGALIVATRNSECRVMTGDIGEH